MEKEEKVYEHKIFKMFLSIVVLIFAIMLIVKSYPYFKLLFTEEGRVEFKSVICNLGGKGVASIIVLLIIKALFIFLPGEPIEVFSGMCYGTVGGLLVIYVGIIISTCLIFLFVRIFGKNFVYTFTPREKIEKFENNKILKSQKLEVVLLMLLLVPGTPKDLVVYIGAISKANPLKFIIIAVIARFPSIISSTFVGSNVLEGKWFVSICAYGITFVLAAITYLLYKYKAKTRSEKGEI